MTAPSRKPIKPWAISESPPGPRWKVLKGDVLLDRVSRTCERPVQCFAVRVEKWVGATVDRLDDGFLHNMVFQGHPRRLIPWSVGNEWFLMMTLPAGKGRIPRRARRSSAWRPVRRTLLGLQGTPATARLLLGAVLLIAALAGANWVVQVVRKPTELLFPVSDSLAKTPEQTWRAYAPLFERYSTAVITPDLLAALAQVEASGNPVARTYWRWRFTRNPFDVYRPASTATGMFQLTDATFAQARRLCIHDHVVVEQGAWYDARSCWFNAFYSRVLPEHAVELTAALLDRTVARTLTRNGISTAALQQRQDLATVIHLCGAGTGDNFAKRRFRIRRGEKCGDHDVRTYLGKVNALKRRFALLSRTSTLSRARAS